MIAEEILTTTGSDWLCVTLEDMLGGSLDNNPEAEEEAGNQQNNTSAQDATTHNTEAVDNVTLSRRTLNISATIIAFIILGLLGGVVITAYRLGEVSEQLFSGVSDVSKEFPSLSRKEGIVPEEVWSWIVAAKADMTLNPHSAHYLLKVSNDGKSLYQASFSSPPRVPTDETYLVCICVSSKNLLNTRSYYELKVTQSVPWTLGLRAESFDGDSTPDTHPAGGIWTIASTGGKIIINDNEVTPTLHVTPARLGLYLDYARGQVSFYDSVVKRHLHTYLTTFKEKLRFYASVQVQMEETQEWLFTFV